jgi:hypothetical protein
VFLDPESGRARSGDPQERPALWGHGAMLVLVAGLVVMLAGCGGSSPKSSPLSAVEKAVHQREARERQAKPADERIDRLGKCAGVYESEEAMSKAVSAAVKPGSSDATYEATSSDIETLRGKLAELAGSAAPEQRAELEGSRRFLLKVGTLVEAFKTHDLSLAQEELSGYRAGMVELGEHIKAACS